MNESRAEMFRYNAWANGELYCASQGFRMSGSLCSNT